MMKYYLILLLCYVNLNSFAKTNSDSTYTMENVNFNSAGISLAGTIFKPRHAHAAVVIVHGSGQEKRMLKIASILAANGIAVLTYDKRGVGESGGIYAGPEVGTNNIDSSNLNLLSLDVSAAANALLMHLPAYHCPLGLIGFSQAGWIIPLAAEQNRNVSFMILFSGPVVTALEQLRFQFYTQGKSSFWERHTEAEAREHVRGDTDLYKFADTDPRGPLATLSLRGLWLYGGKDVQVPVGLSIENLDALKAKGKPYEYQLYPELSHNTAFSKSQEPVSDAIKWIKTICNGTK